jgi:hypothetical protein
MELLILVVLFLQGDECGQTGGEFAHGALKIEEKVGSNEYGEADVGDKRFAVGEEVHGF